MTTDAWLAIAHHLVIFGVFAVLVAEWAIHVQLAVVTAIPALAAPMARGIGL